GSSSGGCTSHAATPRNSPLSRSSPAGATPSARPTSSGCTGCRAHTRPSSWTRCTETTPRSRTGYARTRPWGSPCTMRTGSPRPPPVPAAGAHLALGGGVHHLLAAADRTADPDLTISPLPRRTSGRRDRAVSGFVDPGAHRGVTRGPFPARTRDTTGEAPDPKRESAP